MAEESGYRGSSPSWLRTLRESSDTRKKVKSLATAIAEGKRESAPNHSEADEPSEDADEATAPPRK